MFPELAERYTFLLNAFRLAGDRQDRDQIADELRAIEKTLVGTRPRTVEDVAALTTMARTLLDRDAAVYSELIDKLLENAERGLAS